MFKDVDENKRMLEGSYRKLKSYYYYNKNFLAMRKKITNFEEDEIAMNEAFRCMAEYLAHPKSRKLQDYIHKMLEKINYIVLPKNFETESLNTNKPISNTISRDKKLKSVNFFIDCPIELAIFDTLWAVVLSKIAFENQIISYDVYGNTVNVTSLFNGDEINFESRNFFNRYFNKYAEWRNKAFDQLEINYKNKKDSLLISLDIKAYFYSVIIDFDRLDLYFGKSERFDQIRSLTNLMYLTYKKYINQIAFYRKDLPILKKKNTFLPIGLFSSMVLANVYLGQFDKKIQSQENVKYYGRYVDDMLFVIEKSILSNETTEKIIQEIFVDKGILTRVGSDYYISNYNGLCIQYEKIKTIYISHLESKAIIDIYNDTIRVIPSQMDILYDKNINLSNLDEIAYTVENFTKETKLRDLGKIGVDSFKVGKYFSSLAHRYAHVNISGNMQGIIQQQDSQIQKFFVGSQSVEFYSSWINYMYFLVMTQRNRQLRKFVSDTKKEIAKLKPNALDRKIYAKTATINRKVKEALYDHLNICLMLALSIDIDMVKRHFNSQYIEVKKYIKSNMFDHSLIAFPLANYLDYENDVSYIKMSMKEIGKWPSLKSKAFKFVWSPRFVHYDELLLVLFYYYHRNSDRDFEYLHSGIKQAFVDINHMKHDPFTISYSEEVDFQDYKIKKINIPNNRLYPPREVNIAVGSMNLDAQKCMRGCDRWSNISLKSKQELDEIFAEALKCFDRKKGDVMLLVLPELCFPVYWLGELIRFAKKSQIGVITGLQYLIDGNNRAHNYVASFFPFTSGTKKYKNVFVHIREKNDYSPIEFEELARQGYLCKNRDQASYQIFEWNRINLSTLVCYEMTDVVVRGLLKGRCDLIAAPVFNPDTTYFSNIIDATVRDLHTFIVQANTSHYGDSRVTGPYDRDNKDVFKIKGGDNDHVVIGSIEFKKVKDYEMAYHNELQTKVNNILRFPKKKQAKAEKKKPDIKPLSARYKKLDN